MRYRLTTPFRSVGLLLAMTLATGCGNAGPTPAGPAPSASLAPATAGATPTATPATSPAVTPSPEPSAARTGRLDLAAVRVALETVAEGLDQPVFVTPASDGSGRMFVVEQPGRIRVLDAGAIDPAPFLDITDRVTAGGERGLLGLAFPPGFGPSLPRVFVHYSGDDGATVVSEFTLDAHDPAALDPSSERLILTEPQPFPNHNGGWIGFDPDGMLLIALGDGGAGGDPGNRASNPDELLGKILRVDVLGAADGQAYAIPGDNPFAAGGGRPEILHLGLRNSFRDSIDPATGDLWIGDVGQGSWEEVDVARAGARALDFGWRRWEGLHCYDPATDCDPTGVTMPVAEYGHGEGCSVIGGVVYRGDAIPALRGGYLFGDYCSGTLWAIDSRLDAEQAPVTLLETGASISSISTGEDGDVYLTDLGGRVLRLVAAG